MRRPSAGTRVGVPARAPPRRCLLGLLPLRRHQAAHHHVLCLELVRLCPQPQRGVGGESGPHPLPEARTHSLAVSSSSSFKSPCRMASNSFTSSFIAPRPHVASLRRSARCRQGAAAPARAAARRAPSGKAVVGTTGTVEPGARRVGGHVEDGAEDGDVDGRPALAAELGQFYPMPGRSVKTLMRVRKRAGGPRQRRHAATHRRA